MSTSRLLFPPPPSGQLQIIEHSPLPPLGPLISQFFSNNGWAREWKTETIEKIYNSSLIFCQSAIYEFSIFTPHAN